jgi:hypothetical protein
MWTGTIGCVECVGAGGADIDPDMDVSDVIYPPDISDLPGFSPGLDFRNMQHHIYCFCHVRRSQTLILIPHTYSADPGLSLVNHVENTIGYVAEPVWTWENLYIHPYNKGLAGGARTRPGSKPYRIIRSFSILQIFKKYFCKTYFQKNISNQTKTF